MFRPIPIRNRRISARSAATLGQQWRIIRATRFLMHILTTRAFKVSYETLHSTSVYFWKYLEQFLRNNDSKMSEKRSIFNGLDQSTNSGPNSGASRTFGRDISNKNGAGQSTADSKSPATATTLNSRGSRKNKNGGKLRRKQRRINPRLFKDTNGIYPPNQAYENANKEL